MSETRTDPTEFLGDQGRKKVRAGPVGSSRVRVVEFSYKQHVVAYGVHRLLVRLRRTGRYATYERGLLGLNGLMRVDEGTRCGTNKACYAGDCKSLSYVKQQMVSESK